MLAASASCELPKNAGPITQRRASLFHCISFKLLFKLCIKFINNKLNLIIIILAVRKAP